MFIVRKSSNHHFSLPPAATAVGAMLRTPMRESGGAGRVVFGQLCWQSPAPVGPGHALF